MIDGCDESVHRGGASKGFDGENGSSLSLRARERLPYTITAHDRLLQHVIQLLRWATYIRSTSLVYLAVHLALSSTGVAEPCGCHIASG